MQNIEDLITVGRHFHNGQNEIYYGHYWPYGQASSSPGWQ